MLLEADSDRLYVGARGAVFALNASDISAGSALTVSLFVSVLLHVVLLRCHIFNTATASFAFHNTGTFLRQQYLILRQKYLFPCHPLCVFVCVCVITFYTITHSNTTGASLCINLHINEKKLMFISSTYWSVFTKKLFLINAVIRILSTST